MWIILTGSRLFNWSCKLSHCLADVNRSIFQEFSILILLRWEFRYIYSKLIQTIMKYNQYDCLAHVVLRLVKVWKRLNGHKLCCCKTNFHWHGILLLILLRWEFRYIYSKLIQTMMKYNQYDCLAHVVLRLVKVWKRLNGHKLCCCKTNFHWHGILLFIVYHHLTSLVFWIKRINNEDMPGGLELPVRSFAETWILVSHSFTRLSKIVWDWKSALPASLLNAVLIYSMSGISRDINNIH